MPCDEKRRSVVADFGRLKWSSAELVPLAVGWDTAPFLVSFWRHVSGLEGLPAGGVWDDVGGVGPLRCCAFAGGEPAFCKIDIDIVICAAGDRSGLMCWTELRTASMVS